jgi:mRNA-degrading endonuclease RelE of RelBE toxin-antitoxin system
MVIRRIVLTRHYEHDTKHIKEQETRQRLANHLKKIMADPHIGKPLQYALKAERSVHVPLYRLIYAVEDDTITLLRFEHRKDVYRNNGGVPRSCAQATPRVHQAA